MFAFAQLTGYGLRTARFFASPSESSLDVWLDASEREGPVARKFVQLCCSSGAIIADRRLTDRIERRALDNVAHHPWTWSESCLDEFRREHPQYEAAVEAVQTEPCASGSCAQVHLAGRFAFKILHPDLEDGMARWKELLPLLSMALTAGGKASLATALADILQSIEDQFDLRAELATMTAFKQQSEAYLQPATRFRVPDAYAATKRVLLMERVLAPALHQLQLPAPTLASARASVGAAVGLWSLSSRFHGGLLHCDMHVGNIGVVVAAAGRGAASEPRDFGFVLYDFGLAVPWTDASRACLDSYLEGDFGAAMLAVLGASQTQAVRAACAAARAAALRRTAELAPCNYFSELLLPEVMRRRSPGEGDAEKGPDSTKRLLAVLHFASAFRREDVDFRQTELFLEARDVDEASAKTVWFLCRAATQVALAARLEARCECLEQGLAARASRAPRSCVELAGEVLDSYFLSGSLLSVRALREALEFVAS